MPDLTDCFKLGKTISQNRQLCSSISPASSISSLNNQEYSDFPKDNGESTAHESEIPELDFESQDPDFPRGYCGAHDLFRSKRKNKPILRKPVSFDLFLHVDTTHLIQKHHGFAREADLDIHTLLEEQLIGPVLPVVIKWIRTSETRPQKKPHIIQSSALLSYYNNFEQPFIEHDTDVVC